MSGLFRRRVPPLGLRLGRGDKTKRSLYCLSTTAAVCPYRPRFFLTKKDDATWFPPICCTPLTVLMRNTQRPHREFFPLNSEKHFSILKPVFLVERPTHRMATFSWRGFSAGWLTVYSKWDKTCTGTILSAVLEYAGYNKINTFDTWMFICHILIR